MKYDKYAISSTANRLNSRSSGLNSIQNNLNNVAPQNCNPNFYASRYSLVKRIRNVQSNIYSLSNDINSAAEKMSSDDVQNARYIRQVFNNRSSSFYYGNNGFAPGGAGLSRSGVFGGSMYYSSMDLNRRSVVSMGKSTSTTNVWSRIGNAFKDGATFLGQKASEVGKQIYDGTTKFFNDAGQWLGDRWNDYVEIRKAEANYIFKSVQKFILGDYSNENVTILSFAGNIVAGFFDVDLPLDVRDLVYDIQHWGEGDHFGIYFALDCVALLPVVGVLKNVKYADDVADGVKDLGKIAEAGAEAGKVGKTIDNISDGLDDATDIWKSVENGAEAGKTLDNAAEMADNTKDIDNAAEAAQEAGKSADNVSDAADVSKNVGDAAENAKIKPSKAADPNAKPRGEPSEIYPKDEFERKRAITRENESADLFAQNGYDIEQNPKVPETTRNPDYKIEGEIFDCYSPSSSNPYNIRDGIDYKVNTKQQTNRVVLNMDDTSVTIDEVINALREKPVNNLEEVIVVKGKKIFSIFP